MSSQRIRGGRVQGAATVSRCRVRGCTQSGYGRYCRQHTPNEGVGLLLCTLCGVPLSKHAMDAHASVLKKGNI